MRKYFSANIIMRTVFMHTKLDSAVAEFFLENGQSYSFKKGSHVPVDLMSNNILMLKNGMLGNTQRTDTQNKQYLCVLILPHRLVDYQLILTKEYAACKTVEVLRNSEVLAVSCDKVDQLLVESPALFKKFLNESGYFARKQEHIAVYMMSFPAEKKVRRFLHDVLWAFDLDFSKKWLQLPIRLTRQEIASSVYITTQSLDLLMIKWRKMNLVRKHNNYIVVNTKLFSDLEYCPLESRNAEYCPVYQKY